MKVINLRDIYPHYTQDCFVEVTDEVADLFSEFDHKEAAYRLRTYRHKAYYSLDRNDGIEHEALFVALSPHELYERKVTMQELHAAISRLPNKQAKRIYAHFILGMTKKDIARAEGVHEKVVRVAIERGLRSLEKILKKFCKAYRFRPKNEMVYERQSKPRATLARSSDKPYAA